MRAIQSKSVDQSMLDFREARKIVFGQIQNERLHYPYRVASTFGQFYDCFASDLSPQQKEEIKRAAKHISDRIESLPEGRQQHRHVEDCWRAMQKILNTK